MELYIAIAYDANLAQRQSCFTLLPLFCLTSQKKCKAYHVVLKVCYYNKAKVNRHLHTFLINKM